MKSILLPVHPEILEHILNGDADTLIRKLFPKDYVGWVYIYCTKKPYLYHRFFGRHFRTDNAPTFIGYEPINGFVVARFWCDKVEIISEYRRLFPEQMKRFYELMEKSCLTEYEYRIYANGKDCCAIHISKLEVFDKPRELETFKQINKCKKCKLKTIDRNPKNCNYCNKYVDIAPQNYCYIESEYKYEKTRTLC